MLTVILTGGKSSRMGRDKALLEMDDTTAALALAARYASWGPVAFSVDRPARFPCGPYRELVDAYPGCGPLNGLYSAFTEADADVVFLTATDMLGGDPALARELAARLDGHDGSAVLRRDGRAELLFGVYRRTCLPLVREGLETGRYSLRELLGRLDILLVPEAELSDWDMEQALCNVNTWSDYSQYRQAREHAVPRLRMEPDDAQALLLSRASAPEPETVTLEEAAGRVLAADVRVTVPMPPFDRSPFDGYAFRAADSVSASLDRPVTLRVTEEIPAGVMPRRAVVPGTACRIMTGAPVPAGADTIVKYEETEFTDAEVKIFAPALPGRNIIRRGEDAAAGALLAAAGAFIEPFHLGVFASQGLEKVSVYRRRRAAVLSTGTELAEAGAPLAPGQIYNNSGMFLSAWLRAQGYEARTMGVVPDDPERIAALFSAALTENDLVVSTGGASVGDYDCTLDACRRAGAEPLFWKLAMKPGGAMLAAEKDGKLILGLSGNPGAATLGLLRVALPFLRAFTGRRDVYPEKLRLKLREALNKASPKIRLLRGTLLVEDGEAWFSLRGGQGGGDVSALPGCELLGEIPAGSPPLPAGTLIDAWRLG